MLKRKYRKWSFRLALGITLMCSQAAWGAQYRLVSMVHEGELNSYATDINDAHVVTGYYTVPFGQFGGLVAKGFTWMESGFEAIAPLARHVEKDPDYSYTKAFAVNMAGDVAGESGYANATSGDTKAFLKSSSAMAHPGPWDEDVSSIACGINNNGAVCGRSGSHAALWEGGVQNPLVLDGSTQSTAWDVNDDGVVVGEAMMPAGSRAFMGTVAGAEELASLPGMNGSWARAVNAAGIVAGYALVNGFMDAAVVWQDQNAVQLPALAFMQNARAFGINDVGHVVGEAAVPGSGYPPANHAVLWKDHLTITDLQLQISPAERLNWTLERATAVSAQGWVVGHGTCDGKPAGFVLVPEVSQSVSGKVITMVPGYSLAVKGAVATLEDTTFSFETGADGSFLLSDVPVGDYTLVISAEGLETLRIAVTLGEGEDWVLSESDGQLVVGVVGIPGDTDSSSRLDMPDAHRSLTGSAGL